MFKHHTIGYKLSVLYLKEINKEYENHKCYDLIMFTRLLNAHKNDKKTFFKAWYRMGYRNNLSELMYNYYVEKYTLINESKVLDIEKRGKNTYCLDHKFPVLLSFAENICSYLIGGFSNLQVITFSENGKKGNRSYKKNIIPQ